MNVVYITIADVELKIEFDYEPGEGSSSNCPGSYATADITAVYIDSQEVSTLLVESGYWKMIQEKVDEEINK